MTVNPKLQNATVYSTFIVVILIVIIAVYTALSFQGALPNAPSLDTSTTRSVETVKQDLANYKDLVGTIKTEKDAFFGYVVTDSLAMIFKLLLTSVLTFIFAQPIALAIAERLRK